MQRLLQGVEHQIRTHARQAVGRYDAGAPALVHRLQIGARALFAGRRFETRIPPRGRNPYSVDLARPHVGLSPHEPRLRNGVQPARARRTRSSGVGQRARQFPRSACLHRKFFYYLLLHDFTSRPHTACTLFNSSQSYPLDTDFNGAPISLLERGECQKKNLKCVTFAFSFFLTHTHILP